MKMVGSVMGSRWVLWFVDNDGEVEEGGWVVARSSDGRSL